ncbi:MAG: HAMP domain-containing histidine kinase [Clostridia bacterium]|nr:HAMP domain-containing histidine kinase [Clostridia bacterium]
MWSLFLIIILGAAVLYLGLRLVILRRALRRAALQLNERTALDSNALIRIPAADHGLDSTVDALNAALTTLREWKVRLEQGDRSFNDALVMWAHDLRTPLTAVLGYFELLDGEPQTQTARRYLEALRRRLRDVEDITEELFAFALLKADRDTLKIEHLDLREQTEAVAASFYDAYRHAGIDVEIDLERPQPVLADAVAVKRILYNLMSNALKHHTRRLAVFQGADGSLVFAASGSDFDPVALERLFGRYFSVESARGSQGVGLAVVRSLTERLGGSFTGKVTEGTLEICIKLPPAVRSAAWM